MAIVVKEPDQKDFEHPEDGQYIGVIADVIDLGEVETGYGIKPRVRIVYLLDTNDSEGNPFRVMSTYTASLHEKANLRKALKQILGADVSGQFDLEELLGINNQLVVATTEKDDKVYTNIVAILKAPKGTPRLQIPDDFVRQQDKQKKQATQKKAAPQTKKPTPKPAVVEEQAAEVEQEPAPAPTPAPKAAAPANRAGTIRQARTVTPAPAVAPAGDSKAAAIAALKAQLAAAEAEAASTETLIDGSDIPF
jgi:outer membrane biosynthesis protein TonB